MLAEPPPRADETTVLIVEDDAAQREMLRQLLQHEGFATLDCGNAAKAAEILDENQLSVAILDLRLPDRPGTWVLEKIRAKDEGIQVIMHTGYGSFDSAKDAVNLGAFAYLEKPVNPEDLLRQVRRASEQWIRQALHKSEQRYRILAELSPVGIFHTGAEGGYVAVNRRWSEITGLTSADSLGDRWQQGVEAEDRDSVRAAWQQAVTAGQKWSAEFRFKSDGETSWVYALAWPHTDDEGTVGGYVGTITDLTERKRMEESLQLVETVLEQALVPVLVTTAETEDPRIAWVNDAFSTLTGYSAPEVLGRSPEILYGPKTSRAVREQQRDHLRRGKSFVGDMVNYRKDGSTLVTEWRVDPVRDAEDRITHWVTIFR